MLDFTSALYLGLRHASASLDSWCALTLGRPAAVQEPPGAEPVAADLARMQGCEAATLLPSTLHLFRDLFRMLATAQTAIVVDAGAYPIARWGAETGVAQGALLRSFRHFDVDALELLVRRLVKVGRRVIVVCDGYCIGCASAAPVRAYADIVGRAGGLLVLDDTQALGILGHTPTCKRPYGLQGSGSLSWHRANEPHVIVGSSLAKAFGAPLAVLAANDRLIQRFTAQSEVRQHCSPPSVAAISAARRALEVNYHRGDALRSHLVELVKQLRNALSKLGLQACGAIPFPVQSFVIKRNPGVELLQQRLQQRLLERGIRALETRACDGVSVRLTFLVTALHRLMDIDAIEDACAQILSARISTLVL